MKNIIKFFIVFFAINNLFISCKTQAYSEMNPNAFAVNLVNYMDSCLIELNGGYNITNAYRNYFINTEEILKTNKRFTKDIFDFVFLQQEKENFSDIWNFHYGYCPYNEKSKYLIYLDLNFATGKYWKEYLKLIDGHRSTLLEHVTESLESTHSFGPNLSSIIKFHLDEIQFDNSEERLFWAIYIYTTVIQNNINQSCK